LDLPWGGPIGFECDPVFGDRVAPRVVRYLREHAADFRYLFVSWQPKNRSRLDPADYFPAWDGLFEALGDAYPVRGLHQTTFNLGALEPYDTAPIVAFTNALCERYHLAWVNEDLGLWSLHGRPLPYPLPPYLTKGGLEAAIRNTREVQAALVVPLVVEFPGFSDGTSFYVGDLDAYDFFATLVEATGSPCTLDVGHLLSWRWIRGHRGEALYGGLERLPTEACCEIHLSGCETAGDAFFDYHHGVLMDEQLELLRRLMPLCPNLRGVTYEDPKFDTAGTLAPRALPGWRALRRQVAAWVAQ
jgi:uncharacterized protein (UPF0276 family)